MTPFLRRAAGPLLLALALLLPTAAGAQIPPDVRWTVLETEHFRVHFTPGLDELARRAAGYAEVAREELRQALVQPPAGKIDLVVSDNVDFANGFASALPRNRIVVFAHPPVDDPWLAYYDDWLELVITHELVHVFHLDYAHGPLRRLRTLLGRNPLTFPSFNVPDWHVEGLATYLESRLTRAGRVRGTMHEMVLRTAVLEDRFFSIDRATGQPASWPGGNTRYVYGSMFLTWLADRHGEEAAGRFVRAYGGRLIPYQVDAAARAAYGRQSFTRSWAEWRRELEARYAALADSLRRQGVTEPEVLTREGHNASFPRWSPDGRRIAYAAATGRDHPATRVIDVDGSGDGDRETNELASRTTLGPSSWSADGRWLLTAMVEAADPYRYHSDLFRVEADGGRDRLTRGARVWEPDLSRDGRVVAVANAPGTNVLVVMDSPDGEPTPIFPPSLDVSWATPRWSPDGSVIAVSRWREGGRYDVVLVDPARREVIAEVTNDRAVDSAPAWSPDGLWVLFSSDRSGIANLYAHDVIMGRTMRVTNVLTGAFHPDVSPDGRWITFSYYRSDGFHVARVPFDPSTWREVPPVRRDESMAAAPRRVSDSIPSVAATERPYSPWRSLVPAAWSPGLVEEDVLGTGIGAATGGRDVVERHAWGASAWIFPDRARWEAALGWTYRGLGNPVIGASAYQDWDALADADQLADPDGVPIPTALLERERAAYLTATLARPRFRSYSWLSAGATVRRRERVWDDPGAAPAGLLRDLPAEVGGVVALGTTTARAFDFSVSQQEGVTAAVRLEGRRFTEALEGDDEARGYLRAAGRTQAYPSFRAWGFARHVLALRVASAADVGSVAPGLSLGGDGGFFAGSPLGTGFGLDDELDFPVRGYPTGAQFGDRAVAATAEWRFPIALVERGIRVLPLNLDRLWGSVFADGGTAWCLEICDQPFVGLLREPDPIYSVGTELGADVSLGYLARLRLRVGLAVPLSQINVTATTRERPAPEVYFGFGQSF